MTGNCAIATLVSEPGTRALAIAALAGDARSTSDEVDAAITAFLLDTGRLVARDGTVVPESPTVASSFTRAASAERLAAWLLPNWSVGGNGGGAIVRPSSRDPAAEVLAAMGLGGGVRGAGPSFARALIAATFTALVALDPGEAAELAEMSR